MTSTPNRSQQIAADQSLIDGLQKHASDIPSLILGSQTVTNAALVTDLQTLITLAKASVSARVAWTAAIQAEDAQKTQVAQLLADLRQTLRARFSNDPSTLADFGLSPHTRAAPSPETLVAAAAKAKSTRAARGTKGSKQLAEVHGNVTSVVVTPVTQTDADPAPTPAPATPPVANVVTPPKS